MERMWVRCIQLKTNVILDFGFWSKSERIRTKNIIISYGGTPVIYSLSCSDEVGMHRLLERNKNLTSSLYISPNTFHILKEKFEPMSIDEEYYAMPNLI